MLIHATHGVITAAHKGQMYGDMPYWTHCVDVASEVQNPTFEEYIAAMLHDTIEDTDMTMDQLRENYSSGICDMVELLTKDDSLSYLQNIERIIDSGNIGAMKIKLADNTCNSRGDKSHMTKERRDRLNEKYALSISLLTSAIEKWENENVV